MTENNILELKSENTLLRKQIKEVQNRFEEKIAELSMIREIGMALLHINSFERTCSVIIDVIMNNTIAQNCSIMLMDQDKNQLFLAAASGLQKKSYVLEASKVFSKEGVRYMFKPGKGVAGKAMLEKRPVLVRDTKTCSFFSADIKSTVEIGCLLSIPLIMEDEPIGVLNLSHADSSIFESNYINLFSIISNFVVLAIHSTLNYEKLKSSEAKYRALSEDSSDGIAILQDSFHIYANPRYQELTGYKLEDLKRISIETLLKTPNRAKDFSHTQHVLNKESCHKQFEVQLFGRMGKRVEVEINSSTILYNGKDALIISVRDLAERKKLERQLQHAQKMEAIGTIASGVAHNFRNVLSGISVNNQLVEMKYQGDRVLMAIMEKVNNAVDRGARLVDGLMQFARKDGTKDFKAINLAELIQEVFDLTRKSFDKKIDIQVNIPGSISVIGDHSGLTQVLMNLCVNARDAMPDGGKLRIEARRKEDMAEIFVSDTGHGMDKEALERCFDPFFTSKEVGKGTGLGLSTSYRIIKDHEGDIQAYSEVGKGAVFKIYLPVASESECIGANSIKELIRGSGQRILIVDDDVDILAPMEDLLEGMGYHATFASDGTEAIAKYFSWRPDAVLMDRNMPDMDGITCSKMIIEKDPQARIILISGYDEKGPDGIDLQTREMIFGYLTKPITITELNDILYRLFSSKQPVPKPTI